MIDRSPASPANGTKYQWTLNKGLDTLLRNDTELLVLQQKEGGRAVFTHKGAHYVLQHEGFWNPRTIIKRNGEPVLALRRHFLGGNATIELEDGTALQCKAHNEPLVKLSFLSASGEPILSYRLDATTRLRIILEVNNDTIRNEHLVLLLVLGFHAFRGVILENDASDLVVMVA
jgi:hypothetical protein